MAIFSQYGTGQRIGFALVCVGFCLCFIASIPPYWVQGEISAHLFSSFVDNIPVIGDILDRTKLLTIKIGVWWYCVDSIVMDGEKCYNFYSIDDRDHDGNDDLAWIQVVRVMVVLNGILGFMCMMVACCRCLCCSGGRTICHGIFAFFAGGCGYCALGIMADKNETLMSSVPLVEASSGWCLGVYGLGASLTMIASLLLCCAVPSQTQGGLVLANQGPNVQVQVSQSTVNQYDAGQIRSFEPLPYPQPPPPAAGYYPLNEGPPTTGMK